MANKDLMELGEKSARFDTGNITDADRCVACQEKDNAYIRKIKSDLEKIYSFLKSNREYNEKTQHMAYAASLRPWGDKYGRISSLLHAIFQTQAKPSLNKSSKTWQALFENRQAFNAVQNPAELLTALLKLKQKHGNQAENAGAKTFDKMWCVLKDIPGFGKKTAALFIKAIIDVHTLEVNRELRFLNDFRVDNDDFVRVPVDAVILYIFKCVTGKTLDFVTINELIFKVAGRDNAEATIWDDLWFWGFITQHGGGAKRKLEVNEAKFWTILGSPKDKWGEIEKKSEEFIQILESC